MSSPASSASKKSSKSRKHERSDAADSGSSKKAKSAVPMAFFCLIGSSGNSTGYFVPISLLPSLKQVQEDIEDLGSYDGTLYYKGKEISRDDEILVDELEGKDGFGDILHGCIEPLAVKTLQLSESDPLTASVQYEFFALISEEY